VTTSSREAFDEYRRERGSRERTSSSGGRQRSIPRLFLELARLLRGSWPQVLAGIALGTAATLLKLTPPAATKLAIDHVLLGQEIPAWLDGRFPVPADPRVRLLLLVAVVLSIILVGSLLSLAGRWFVTVTMKRVQERMRRRVFAHASRLPLHRIYELRAGGAGTLLREDAGGVGELVMTMLFNPWRAVIQFLGGLFVLAWIDWRMLACALLLTPVIVVSSSLWNRRLRPLFRDIRARRADVDARTAEVFGGMRVVRAFGRVRREAARYARVNDLTTRMEMLAWWASSWATSSPPPSRSSRPTCGRAPSGSSTSSAGWCRASRLSSAGCGKKRSASTASSAPRRLPISPPPSGSRS